MVQHSIARIKCAMIVYELERALGRYVREKGSQASHTETGKMILTRSSVANDVDSTHQSRLIVENSYLGEVFSLAQICAVETSEAASLASLEKLSTALEIFDIRNAISHPNRPFPDCFWYRCATIAVDPTIDALGFFEVSLAFQNADQGTLQEPPEDWMYKKRWSVPAVLPADFEHSITGLVGRTRDIAVLQKELKNRRAPLIALVAKGGVGKTSLMQQVVSDFCLSTESAQFFDGVLWTSFKQERLTSTGVQILTAPASLEDMKDILCKEASEIFGEDFNSFEQLKNRLRKKRLLLCLDNLETLLRDSPTTFNSFYEELPEDWKVVVTSRIPVDSAKNVPLGVLDKSGAIALARAYLSSKGHPTKDNDLLERIAIGCNFNPLAIRITIDLYVSGAEISEALQKSEKDVLAFSFTSLLDQLSELENQVLETVFALDTPNRSEICGALECSVDEAAEAISKLSKTSLLTRLEADNSEVYSLGSSIRDLLRSHPRNLAMRSKAAEWLMQSKATAESALKLQLERNISPVDLNYIPSNTPASLIAISKKIKAAVKREDRAALVQIEGELRHKLFAESDSSFLCRLYARATFELDDHATAVNQFKRACALNPDDPAPMFGLALAYQRHNISELYQVTKSLINGGWGSTEKAGEHHANRIWGLFLHSANIAERFSEVFDSTADWEAKLDSLPSLAIGRASAYRRQADEEFRKHECDTRRLGNLLAMASKPMLKTIIAEGFQKWLMPELRKLTNEIRYYDTRGVNFRDFEQENRTAILNLLRFCLSNEANRKGIDSKEISILISIFTEIGGQAQELAPDEATRSNFQKNGFTFGRVKNGMRGETSYVFVQDHAGEDYFVHLDVFDNGDWQKRGLLAPGVELAFKFDPNRTGNALRATEAWLVA